MSASAVYSGIFFAALVAATILPAQSEILLGGALLSGLYSTPALLAVATIGNVLGSVINWLLGRGIERFRNKRWFPASAQQMARAEAHYQRWGYWSLLLSWVPVIGDPLTVIAGVLREPFWRFLAIVALAKGGRYLVLAAVVLNYPIGGK